VPGNRVLQQPSLATASETTRQLHQRIDANAPYLHPDRRTLQRDLGSSAEVHAWQRAKAACLDGGGVWSDLPHLYARYGNPGAAALIAALRELEHARCALVTDSGMQAIALVVDALVARGTHVIAMRQVYNKTRAFLELTAARVGAALTLIDDGDHAAVEAALRPETRLVIAETYTNPLMRAQDVPRLVELTRRVPGARLVIDSTIATPWGVRTPLLGSGVAVIASSLTKALGGEDVVLGGYIATDDVALANQLQDLLAMRGGILDDDSATRVTAGLARAGAMHARRCDTAARGAAWLAAHPRVEQVFHPSRPDHPDAAVIARDYTRCGSLLGVRLRGVDEAGHGEIADRIASCGIIRYALSFDGLVSKVNHHRTVSEYRTPVETIERLGIDRLIRLGIGLEDADDLIACLAWSLA
jgi:cystathionine beta-lyase/cystathionine gamma-synthase